MTFDSHMHVGRFPAVQRLARSRGPRRAHAGDGDLPGAAVRARQRARARDRGGAAAASGRSSGPTRTGPRRSTRRAPSSSTRASAASSSTRCSTPTTRTTRRCTRSCSWPASADCPSCSTRGHPIFTLPWSIEEVAANFPETKVVFGHMGHGNIVYINASIDIACRRPERLPGDVGHADAHEDPRGGRARRRRPRDVRLGRALPPSGGGAAQGAAQRARRRPTSTACSAGARPRSTFPRRQRHEPV